MAAERALEGSRACIACGTAVHARRCEHCGAAQVAGHWRIVRVIAERPGGSGRIYLAENAQGQQVALKELLFALVPNAQQLDAFLREGKVLETLSHPQVPRFVASFQEGSGVGTRLYLAQEFVAAPSLADRLRTHRFTIPQTIAIARDVLEILAYLHGRFPKVLHRDIKPANLLQREDGRIVLVDFGAARLLAKDATHNATAVGTFGYMPLEQLGGTVDETSDLYALGATLLHLIEGRPPEQMLRDGMYLQVDPDLPAPPELVRFLARLVAPKREQRYPSAREALRLLDEVEYGARTLELPDPQTIRMRAEPPRSRTSTVPREVVVLPRVEAPLVRAEPQSIETPEQKRDRRGLRLAIALLVLALGVLTFAFAHSTAAPSTNPSILPPPIVPLPPQLSPSPRPHAPAPPRDTTPNHGS